MKLRNAKVRWRLKKPVASRYEGDILFGVYNQVFAQLRPRVKNYRELQVSPGYYRSPELLADLADDDGADRESIHSRIYMKIIK